MAYINANFEHQYHNIKIEVLEPTSDENDYKEGMKIQVDWDSMATITLKEFRYILKWMSERGDYIEANFTKKGKPKSSV